VTTLHFPWLLLTAAIPFAGSLWTSRVREPGESRRRCIIVATLTLIAAGGAWLDFVASSSPNAADPLLRAVAPESSPLLVLEEVSAPLLPHVALLFWLIVVVTPRTKMPRFSFANTLVSEGISLSTFASHEPWVIVMLLIAAMLPPWLELRSRGKPTGVFTAYMATSAVCLVAGWALASSISGREPGREWVLAVLMAGLLIRKGIAPFHSWVPDLFDHATFGTALLFVVPMVDVWAAIRLIVPLEPVWVLRSLGMVSLLTAVYAAGMALVQRDARRFFAYLFVSHSALVFVGLDTVNPVGLTGGLCLWLSSGLALAGFGLALRALEARRGRMSLSEYHGGHDQMPVLAACFLMTGLASVGFPGTFGFVGAELVVDSAVEIFPHVGVMVGLAAALNGIAVVHAYFMMFTGRRHVPTISLMARRREKLGMITLAAVLLAGGLYPQPFVASRFHAAESILGLRPRPAANEIVDDESFLPLPDDEPAEQHSDRSTSSGVGE
jgi:NADH-quinone oxidoreductase subunit M